MRVRLPSPPPPTLWSHRHARSLLPRPHPTEILRLQRPHLAATACALAGRLRCGRAHRDDPALNGTGPIQAHRCDRPRSPSGFSAKRRARVRILSVREWGAAGLRCYRPGECPGWEEARRRRLRDPGSLDASSSGPLGCLRPSARSEPDLDFSGSVLAAWTSGDGTYRLARACEHPGQRRARPVPGMAIGDDRLAPRLNPTPKATSSRNLDGCVRLPHVIAP